MLLPVSGSSVYKYDVTTVRSRNTVCSIKLHLFNCRTLNAAFTFVVDQTLVASICYGLLDLNPQQIEQVEIEL